MAEQGERVVVERDARPQVVIPAVAEFERLRGGEEPADWEAESRTGNRRPVQAAGPALPGAHTPIEGV